MIYLRYLRTVLLHKWYVFRAGLWLGVPLWQLLIHDLSKFSPAEFGPYARRFGKGTAGSLNHATEAEEWQDAWHHHWTNNPHHWEFWLWHHEDGTHEAQPMPDHYTREMVADWCGAGRAYTGKWDIQEWYAQNSERIGLHPDTRAKVERLIAGLPYG